MQFKAKNNFNRKLNNLLDRYKCFLAILFFCGFNLRVFKLFNRFRILSIIYSVSLVIVTTSATIYCCASTNVLQTFSLFEYILSVFILIIYNSKITKFSFKLHEIDIYLRINFNHYFSIRKKVVITIILLWIIRICYTSIHCLSYNCSIHLIAFILSLFASFSLDLNRVWRFIVLDIVYHRLSLLRKRLEETTECNYYLYVNKNKIIKEDKIKFCINLYRSIADITDLISPELHASMFVSIVCSIPKLIINIYHVLLVLEGVEPAESIGFLIMHISHVCFLLFSPCILIELHLVEVEKIRCHLLHRLIEEKDPNIKSDISDFLTYTNIRNFESKIWRFIPMNISLPIEIASMCASTMIVIINFTHLYG